ncbi:unnamed protein product [Owenia fusiformis]|uniref:Mammalian ependymin-related protein 1 n=1 Tax=Owenia fusiformis TaxID=6347 RepID=A0A8J1Y799_OWEFU|nr:unnamed protein product [Owenia fusiformis]
MNVLFVLSLVAVAFGQGPQRCETPKQWEGEITMHDHTDGIETRAKLTYDGVGERTRWVDRVFLNGKTEFYDTLRLHRENVEYVVDLRTKKCERRPLTERFRVFEIPLGAKSMGEAYVGSSALLGSGVLVGLWEATLSDRDNGLWTGQWAVDGCVPVWDHLWHNRVNYTSIHFYDITLGISDPNVFLPPAECGRH